MKKKKKLIQVSVLRKLFTSSLVFLKNKLDRFASVKPFRPSLIFKGKAGMKHISGPL
jgi:hypothetical protein